MGEWRAFNWNTPIQFDHHRCNRTQLDCRILLCRTWFGWTRLAWLAMARFGSAWLKYNRLTKGHKRHNRAFISMWTNEKTEKKTATATGCANNREIFILEFPHAFFWYQETQRTIKYTGVYARLVRCCFQPNGSCRKVTKLKLSCVFSTREKKTKFLFSFWVNASNVPTSNPTRSSHIVPFCTRIKTKTKSAHSELMLFPCIVY